MKENKKITKTSTAKKTKKTAPVCDCSAEKQALSSAEGRISTLTTGEDLRMAVLIVSVVINLFFLIAWVTLQVTDVYDGAVASMLFERTLIR